MLHNCLSLCGVEVAIYGVGDYVKYQIAHTLQSSSLSNKDLQRRLDCGTDVKIKWRYHQSAINADCSHPNIRLAERHEGLRQTEET